MATGKLLAGHSIRRLRRRAGLTQAAMADMLAISPSYLNLIERNQRALPSGLLVRLAEQFDFDARSLSAGEPGGGVEAVRRRLSDPLFADLEIDRHELAEWLAAAPGGVEAFARAFDRAGGSARPSDAPDDTQRLARKEIERWRNHFPDLDAAAETLADELRLVGADLYGALVERLRVKHGIAIRILPVDVLPDVRRRFDLHARQLQLSELLPPSSRTFALAAQVAQLEARAEIDALVRGAGFADRTAERLLRRHLVGYFAAAVMMPYARLLRACEATGYDVDVLRGRFGASFEQVAHRLTTLQRVGARGLSFFMIRIDRAGQCSKRFVGASGAAMVEAEGRCPLWRIHHAFERAAEDSVQLVELEDGSRWFSQARVVRSSGVSVAGVVAEHVVAIGLPAEQARSLSAARGLDVTGAAMPIGFGCRLCLREGCPQRAAPPDGRAIVSSDKERGLAPIDFAGG